MSPVVYDVTYTERHSRLTTAFRYILALPHLVWLTIWGYAVQFAALLQWFVILFTGERNEGLWRFQRGWMGYAGRVYGYEYLLHDTWPAFGTSWGDEPVAFGLQYEAKANRLTNLLRLIWAIPAAIILMILAIGMGVILIIAWFAIVITGRLNRGFYDFMLRVSRMSLSLTAYLLLMTDNYPRYDGVTPTSALAPGDLDRNDGRRAVMPPAGGGNPLPPPTGPPAG
jgi:Domain of unknown function (DUF4389)